MWKFSLSIFILLVSITNGLNAGKLQKKVGIFTYKFQNMPKWDPDSIHEGVSGSEEAVIYISEHLAKLGFQVIIYGNPPQNSRHSIEGLNPRYIDIDHDDQAEVDVAIVWRSPDLAPALKKRAQKVFFWPHDTCGKTYNQEVIDVFDDVFWLSQFQRLNWVSKNASLIKFEKIYGNGINPEQFQMAKEKNNPHSCIYASNYARGLEVLLDIWPLVKRHFPSATLDIYYGWNTWGLLHPQTEAKMRSQIRVLNKLGVTDHGKVSHSELHEAFAKASIWAYPCIMDETFCITGSKAQLCEAIPAVINHSALMETVRGGVRCTAKGEYCRILMKAMIQAESMTESERKELAKPILDNWTWEKIAKEWAKSF